MNFRYIIVFINFVVLIFILYNQIRNMDKNIKLNLMEIENSITRSNENIIKILKTENKNIKTNFLENSNDLIKQFRTMNTIEKQKVTMVSDHFYEGSGEGGQFYMSESSEQDFKLKKNNSGIIINRVFATPFNIQNIKNNLQEIFEKTTKYIGDGDQENDLEINLTNQLNNNVNNMQNNMQDNMQDNNLTNQSENTQDNILKINLEEQVIQEVKNHQDLKCFNILNNNKESDKNILYTEICDSDIFEDHQKLNNIEKSNNLYSDNSYSSTDLKIDKLQQDILKNYNIQKKKQELEGQKLKEQEYQEIEWKKYKEGVVGQEVEEKDMELQEVPQKVPQKEVKEQAVEEKELQEVIQKGVKEQDMELFITAIEPVIQENDIEDDKSNSLSNDITIGSTKKGKQQKILTGKEILKSINSYTKKELIDIAKKYSINCNRMNKMTIYSTIKKKM